MNDRRLFALEGETRPPGIADTVRPEPGLVVICPMCTQRSLAYETPVRAECEYDGCGYEWTRSAQLHHTETIPF